ncbi:MAG: hypothetical protein JOZ41_20145 [Chloroflexi bacterium]|nr:hypothetical protein [Chloroflexota bacterium]
MAAGPHPSQRHARPAVALEADVGYGGWYRAAAWVPVRVSLHNRSSALVRGTIAIPDRATTNDWFNLTSSALYQSRVVLPPGATKWVTLYLPGEDLHDGVEVRFQATDRTAVRASEHAVRVGDGTVAIAALTDDPQLILWLHRARPRHAGVDVFRLAPAALDPVPEALATFDAIVLTHVATSSLDAEQRQALVRYVQDGGSLVLVGGPDWQETLRPLPPDLLPGRLSGSRLVHDLSALRAVAGSPTAGSGPPPGETAVSVLRQPRGTVLAAEGGVPLMVRDRVGRGRIIYLAFDPSIEPIPRWTGGTGLVTDLVMQASPQVLLAYRSLGDRQPASFMDRFTASAIARELANAPGERRPVLSLLGLLAALSILILGPFNFLVLRRLRQRDLACVTTPALAVLCLGVTVALVDHLRGNLALVNSVGLVELDGSSPGRPATIYAGLFAPLGGDYHLVWDHPSLPRSLPHSIEGPRTSPRASPPDAQLWEGTQTAVDFPSMTMGAMRGVSLATTVTIRGRLSADLHLAPDGSIAGVIRNDTHLRLIRPLIVADRAVLHLADLPPGASRRVRIRPALDFRGDERSLLWDQIYGTPPGLLGRDVDPWAEPPPSPEPSLTARLSNVAERLPEARGIFSWGDVLFAGWTTNPLGRFTVDGATPLRRDLSLIVAPLTVEFPLRDQLNPARRPIRLLPGTLGAYLVDGQPQPPPSSCCFSSFTQANQTIVLGVGGSATFQLDLPPARSHHFRRLTLSLNAGGADQSRIGQVFDWRARRWANVDLEPSEAPLPRPDRFVSPSGALLVRLRALPESGDLTITDPHQDLQISGWG